MLLSLQLPDDSFPSSPLDAQSAESCVIQARERLTRELGSARHDAADPNNHLTKPGLWTTVSCCRRVKRRVFTGAPNVVIHLKKPALYYVNGILLYMS